jgi:hypothetical protein
VVLSDPVLGNTSPWVQRIRYSTRRIIQSLLWHPPRVRLAYCREFGREGLALLHRDPGRQFHWLPHPPPAASPMRRSQSDEQERTNRLDALLVLHSHQKWPTTTRPKGNRPSTRTPPKGSSLDSNRSSSNSTPGTFPSTTPHSSHMATSSSSSRPSMRDTAGKQCPCLLLRRWERP